ncbi:hypothetical protein [Arthrobacter sp. 18067]|uniref:hypothetical protein n=1 Tax=Arthrobacter sp. 18067 TaxID=2681413 RepID=UPI00135BE7CE|nr:hypothetical protein [Arthrobacter sp. 18067]
MVIVLPPTTLVTALAFWFGYNFTASRTYYLGVDANMLGYSTVDYLLRSGEPVIVPIAVLLAAGLVVLIMHAIAGQLILRFQNSRVIRAGFVVLIALGAIAVAVAVRSMFVVLAGYYLLPPILLGGGAGLAGYSFHMLRTNFNPKARIGKSEAPEWERAGYVIVVLLIILSLFWGMTLYAGALGLGRAQALESNLAARPGVKIYSKQSLALRHPEITETRLDLPDSDYHFEYSGLRLLVYSAGKYFLLPENWTHDAGTTFVLQDSPDIRIEFTPGRS